MKDIKVRHGRASGRSYDVRVGCTKTAKHVTQTNEVCFGDERTSKIYNQVALLAMGYPKAAEQAMHTKCLSAMRCPKAAELNRQCTQSVFRR